MDSRYSPEHVETWRRDGAVRIERFFSADEVKAVQADFDAHYRRNGDGQALVTKGEGEVGRFNPGQFLMVEPIPLKCSPALNLIGVHPALMDFAKAALGTNDVHMYQCQAWAKFTGDADYDQPFHCDFVNHTLTVPSDGLANAITIICYFSDVSETHGPMHYVPRTASAEICGPEATLMPEGPERAALQTKLAAVSRSSASPAGTIHPYSIDVYHRGTNMTAPGGHRYAVMACYRAAEDAAIGFTAWAFHHMKPWRRIFDHATPEQLACFGVKRPGDPFWTETTIAQAQTRWPGWDMTPYREALAG
jgi:hypothetical protein